MIAHKRLLSFPYNAKIALCVSIVQAPEIRYALSADREPRA